jgi:hypothetical protein
MNELEHQLVRPTFRNRGRSGRGCILRVQRRERVGFKLCVRAPVDLDGLPSAQLKELVASLFAKLGELVQRFRETNPIRWPQLGVAKPFGDKADRSRSKEALY